MPFAICKKRGKMLYIEQSIKKYLEDLSAKLPAPGGGSVAALTGALAGGLISMVCNFTIGNPKFPDLQQNECMGILSSAGSVREELCRLIDEDVRVYGKVSIAYKLPKDTEEQKAKRAIVIQEVLKEAMQVPEQILKLSYQLLELAEKLLEAGNPGLITDTGMAAVLSCAAMESALLNVEINLSSITDKEFTEKTRIALKPLMAKGGAIKYEVVKKINRGKY